MRQAPAPLHPDTVAVGLGYDPQSCFGAIKPPVVMTSTFAYPSAAAAKEAHAAYFDGAAPADGAEAGYIYARLDNPNLSMVEARLAALDHAEDCAAFASGMAAISATMLVILRPGDTLLHTRPLYGGTHALLHGPLSAFGVAPVAIADALDAGSYEAADEEALPKARSGSSSSRRRRTRPRASPTSRSPPASPTRWADARTAARRSSWTTPFSGRSSSRRWTRAPTSP
jgi:cystathionine gamma-synthase/methionine-gamma-lyase